VWISLPLFHPPSFVRSHSPSLFWLYNKQRTRVLLDDAAWAIPTDESEIEGGRKSNRDTERDRQERDREIRNWIQERTERRAKGRQEGIKETERVKKEWGMSKAWRLRMKGCPIRPQVAALYTQFLHFREKAWIWQHDLLSRQLLLETVLPSDYKCILIYRPKHCHNKPTHLLITAFFEDTDTYVHTRLLQSNVYLFVLFYDNFPLKNTFNLSQGFLHQKQL